MCSRVHGCMVQCLSNTSNSVWSKVGMNYRCWEKRTKMTTTIMFYMTFSIHPHSAMIHL
ncbi:uncharacterized protein LOC6539177 isoform X6 [Drosophila yakuba]|uniref:uncharacterized protein LOC6539177 isoform X6 n=1 Tax=Drosophila yakuba TaxID=7245 RepID=UPI0019307B82|nr:uncharacterized protein LOC6539177 isoform X6 [Drosophila yakuba]